jgi:hypothetical protein
LAKILPCSSTSINPYSFNSSNILLLNVLNICIYTIDTGFAAYAKNEFAINIKDSTDN